MMPFCPGKTETDAVASGAPIGGSVQKNLMRFPTKDGSGHAKKTDKYSLLGKKTLEGERLTHEQCRPFVTAAGTHCSSVHPFQRNNLKRNQETRHVPNWTFFAWGRSFGEGVVSDSKTFAIAHKLVRLYLARGPL